MSNPPADGVSEENNNAPVDEAASKEKHGRGERSEVSDDSEEQDIVGEPESKEGFDPMLLTEDTPVSAFLGSQHQQPDSVEEELHNQLLDDMDVDHVQPQDLTTPSRTIVQPANLVCNTFLSNLPPDIVGNCQNYLMTQWVTGNHC